MLSHMLRAAAGNIAAFPVLNNITTTAKTATGTTLTVNLPTGIVAGNGLIIIATAYNRVTLTTPTGWTLVATGVSAAASGPRSYTFIRLADGTEGSTITSTMSSAREATAISARITNFGGVSFVEGSIIDSGSTSSPNPPSETASWGSAKNLWLAMVGARSNTTVSSYPANYTLYQTSALNPSGSNRGLTFMAGRELETATEDPGAFTLGTGDDTVAGTIVICGTPTPRIPPVVVSSTIVAPGTLQSTVDITTPAGAASGDYLVAFVIQGTRTFTTPSGWTLLDEEISNTSGRMAAYGRLLTAAPAGSYTFTISGTSSIVGSMVAIRNVTTATGAGQSSTGSTSIVAPSVTAPASGILLCGFEVEGNTTITLPAALTQLQTSLSGNSTRRLTVASEAVSSGATGSRTATAGASGANVGISVIVT